MLTRNMEGRMDMVIPLRPYPPTPPKMVYEGYHTYSARLYIYRVLRESFLTVFHSSHFVTVPAVEQVASFLHLVTSSQAVTS